AMYTPVLYTTRPTSAFSPLSLHDALPIYGRGDAYCGMLNCSYNLGMRHIDAYIPEYPVGTCDDIAKMIADFVPIARGILGDVGRSEEHTSELQSRFDLVCRLLLEKKKTKE